MPVGHLPVMVCSPVLMTVKPNQISKGETVYIHPSGDVIKYRRFVIIFRSLFQNPEFNLSRHPE
jgi:hypothetical protein